MLPCEYVGVSLVSIGSQKHPLRQFSGDGTKPVENQRATVLHLANYCDDSFVEVDFVRKLFREKHGPDTPVPYIDNDTRVLLQWQYPALDEPEPQVTKHRVLRDSRYQIILRRQDWEAPIRWWLQSEFVRQRQQQQQQQDGSGADIQRLSQFDDDDEDGEASPPS